MRQYQVQSVHDTVLSGLGQKPMVIGKFVYFAGGLGACQLYVSSGALARRQAGTYYKTRSTTIREVTEKKPILPLTFPETVV